VCFIIRFSLFEMMFGSSKFLAKEIFHFFEGGKNA
jgi:hypothetical protein